MCFDCFLADEAPHTSDDKYYIVYGRLTSDAVQMFLGYVSTSKGDTEFDAVASELDLQSYSYTEDNFEAAEEWAKKDARKIHPTLPIEIRFMECGAVVSPGAVLLLPVNENEPHTCQTCQNNGEDLKQWRSVWKWGYPFFCSQQCLEKWYEELPFQTQAIVPENIEVSQVQQEVKS